MAFESIRISRVPCIAFIRRYGIVLAVGLLVVFAGIFLLTGRGEIAEAVQLLGSVSPLWIVLLAGLQAIVILISAVTYRLMLRRQGCSVGLVQLAEIHLRRVLVGTITPLGGPPSLYVFVRSLKPHGVSGSDALIAASTRSVTGFVAFLLLLIPALLLQDPSTLVSIATAILFFNLVVLLTGSVFLLRQAAIPDVVQRWAPEPVLTFIETAKAHRLTPVDFVLPTLLGFSSHVTVASMLFVGLQAVGYHASVGTVLVGYVIGKVFFMMAPVFQGIGVVELGMAIALQQAGVTAAVAVSAALLYRVGDLWLPLSWAVLIQIVRTKVVRSVCQFLATIPSSFERKVQEVPRGIPEIKKQLIVLGQFALVMEASAAVTIGILVTLGASLPVLG